MAEHPFAVQGIDHIVLRVRELQRSLTFYCDLLGCTIEREQAELGLTQLRAGSSLIDLVTLDGPLGAGAPPGAGRNLEHFCLTIAPFEEDALIAWLRARGVAAREPGSRYGAQGAGRSFYIEDPDGNHVELKAARSAK
ncbi:MAG TPA: VOC family protein [Steroidobacteraceae bacterium]|jgi:catechol 2,3-dioxygenase-like lactoylglutathione lyase family enzyme|nr:VOC family protein [Steroidobacteraceae bacterium]